MSRKPFDLEREVWLLAWRDHLAGLSAYSSCIELCDVNGDTDYKLVVANLTKRLKVFGGTSLVHEGPLLDLPIAVTSFYSDYTEEVRKPLIAVACGSFVFIYRQLRPHYKFTVPPVELTKAELDVWSTLQGLKEVDANAVASAADQLEKIKELGASLSNRSMDLLALDAARTKPRVEFVEKCRAQPLVQHTVVTCMATLRKDKDEPTALGCLVIGTEAGKLLILDRTASNIAKKIQLPSAPVELITSGLADVEYRIIAACRNGRIHIIKNGELLGPYMEAGSQPVCMARMENHVVVATMSAQLLHFSLKGNRLAAIQLPAPATAMCSLVQGHVRHCKSIVVALANGELRVYTGRALVHKMQLNDTATGLKVGRYGREDSTLCVVLKSGAVNVYMLPRSANFDVPHGNAGAAPPPEQDIPLNVPKRTSLYIEQTTREKENAAEMHRVFQRDISRLRLATARAYAKVLTDKPSVHVPFTTTGSLRLTSHVQGLGPVFRLRLAIQNISAKPLVGLLLAVQQGIYSVRQPNVSIPCLLPGVLYNVEVDVVAAEDCTASGTVTATVMHPPAQVPLVNAIVRMPVPDVLIQTSGV